MNATRKQQPTITDITNNPADVVAVWKKYNQQLIHDDVVGQWFAFTLVRRFYGCRRFDAGVHRLRPLLLLLRVPVAATTTGTLPPKRHARSANSHSAFSESCGHATFARK